MSVDEVEEAKEEHVRAQFNKRSVPSVPFLGSADIPARRWRRWNPTVRLRFSSIHLLALNLRSPLIHMQSRMRTSSQASAVKRSSRFWLGSAFTKSPVRVIFI